MSTDYVSPDQEPDIRQIPAFHSREESNPDAYAPEIS